MPVEGVAGNVQRGVGETVGRRFVVSLTGDGVADGFYRWMGSTRYSFQTEGPGGILRMKREKDVGAKFKKASTIILASIATMLAGLCIFLIGQSLWPQSGPAISDERQAATAQSTHPTESVLVRHHVEDVPQAASLPGSYDVTQGSDYAALYQGAPDNSLIVCAKRENPRYPSDFQSQFDHGKIVVPKGAVFLWGGHYFGPLEDPRDDRNLVEHSDQLSWSGTDAAEQARRNDMGGSIRWNRDKERKLFHVDVVPRWMQFEGAEMIRAHMDKMTGQGTLAPKGKKGRTELSPRPFSRPKEAAS